MMLRSICLALFGGLLTACGETSDPPTRPAVVADVIEAAETEAPKPELIYDGDLQSFVREARLANDIIGYGAVIASSSGLEQVAVSGLHRADGSDLVQDSDAWHIGSNTKALTALLYARLVADDKAEWGATLPDLFPDLAADMDPAWSNITIEDLLAHRSGIGQVGGLWLLARRSDENTPQQQRLATVTERLANPPQGTPGKFEYSNLGYIAAGAAIEEMLSKAAGKPVSWDEAIEAIVFAAAPDEAARTGWGTGPPLDGLQGHHKTLLKGMQPVGTGIAADNPEALSPAGTLHVPLASHALLLTEFLKTRPDFLPLDMREKLWTPYPDDSSTYALGWGIYDDPDYGRLWTHNGSNTMWLSTVVIAPDLDRVIILNANQHTRDIAALNWSAALELLRHAKLERDAQLGLK